MGYSSEQRKVLSAVIKEGQRRKVSKKVLKAAIETVLVEANATNPNGGDLDSVGAFQQRTPWGSTKSRLNVRQSAGRFYDRAEKIAKDHPRAGTLAQAVQVSAYPERYQQRSGEAAKILKMFKANRGGQNTEQVAGNQSTKPQTVVTGNVPETNKKAAIVDSLLEVASGAAKPGDLLTNTSTRIASGGYTSLSPQKEITLNSETEVPAKSKKKSAQNGQGVLDGYKTKGPLVKVDGQWVNRPVAIEVIKAKKAGWKGKIVDGHRSHKEQAELYRNEAGNGYPVARPGTSYHEKSGPGTGAVDVTDWAGLNRVLRKMKSPLKWAGDVDAVHFSIRDGSGSY